LHVDRDIKITHTVSPSLKTAIELPRSRRTFSSRRVGRRERCVGGCLSQPGITRDHTGSQDSKRLLYSAMRGARVVLTVQKVSVVLTLRSDRAAGPQNYRKREFAVAAWNQSGDSFVSPLDAFVAPWRITGTQRFEIQLKPCTGSPKIIFLQKKCSTKVSKLIICSREPSICIL